MVTVGSSYTFLDKETINLWGIDRTKKVRLSVSSVQFTQSCQTFCDLMDSLHARHPCPSPTPGAYSNSFPLRRWCHPTISSSVVPFFPAFSLYQHQGLFEWVGFSYQVARVLDFKLQHQSFQWLFSTDFLKDWLVGSPCIPRDSSGSSPTPQFKSINSSTLSFLYSPTIISIHDYWKNHSLD